jgi:hypothetical protein
MIESMQKKDTLPEDCPHQFMVQYASCNRHWHAESEHFTGVDSLMSMLSHGWILKPVIGYEEYGARLHHTIVYHIRLERGQEGRIISVVNNPVISQFIVESPVWVVPIEDWQDFSDERTAEDTHRGVQAKPDDLRRVDHVGEHR